MKDRLSHPPSRRGVEAALFVQVNDAEDATHAIKKSSLYSLSFPSWDGRPSP
jgi:hypothetical protein